MNDDDDDEDKDDYESLVVMQFNLKLVFFLSMFFVSPLATNLINDVEWIQNSVYFLRAFFDIYLLVFLSHFFAETNNNNNNVKVAVYYFMKFKYYA